MRISTPFHRVGFHEVLPEWSFVRESYSSWSYPVKCHQYHRGRPVIFSLCFLLFLYIFNGLNVGSFNWFLVKGTIEMISLIRIDNHIWFYTSYAVDGISFFVWTNDRFTYIIFLFTISTISWYNSHSVTEIFYEYITDSFRIIGCYFKGYLCISMIESGNGTSRYKLEDDRITGRLPPEEQSSSVFPLPNTVILSWMEFPMHVLYFMQRSSGMPINWTTAV